MQLGRGRPFLLSHLTFFVICSQPNHLSSEMGKISCHSYHTVPSGFFCRETLAVVSRKGPKGRNRRNCRYPLVRTKFLMYSSVMNIFSTKSPAQFTSLSSLISEGGPVAAMLNPTPSRRSLARSFRAAGVPFWKSRGNSSPGRGEIYFDRAAVEVWLKSKVVHETGKVSTRSNAATQLLLWAEDAPPSLTKSIAPLVSPTPSPLLSP